MSFAGSMESPFWNKLNQAYLEMLPKLMGPDTSAEAIDQIKKVAADATAAFGGPIAGSLTVDAQSKPPFEFKYVAAMKDTQKWAKVMDQVAGMMSTGPIADFYKNMGVNAKLDLKRNAESYKGVAIDSVVMSMEPTDTDSPQAEAITAMYSGGTQRQPGDGGQLARVRPGQGTGTGRQEADRPGQGERPEAGTGRGQGRDGPDPRAEKADFFLTANVLRLMTLIKVIAPVPLPQTEMASQSNLAVAGNAGDGKLTVELALPKQHLLEIVGVVMQMQQGM